MREQRGACFDRDVVTQLEFRGIGAAAEPFDPTTHAGRELGRVAKARAFPRMTRSNRRERRARRRVEVDGDHGAFGLALLGIREHLARPHCQPAIGQFDLSHRHRARIRKVEQQRMAIRRVARHADGIRHQFVGDGSDRAFEDLGQPVVRMQFLPDGRRRDAPREAVNQNHLLADPEASLQHLGLDALEFGVVLQQRLEARRILSPQRLPQGQRLQECVPLARPPPAAACPRSAAPARYAGTSPVRASLRRCAPVRAAQTRLPTTAATVRGWRRSGAECW